MLSRKALLAASVLAAGALAVATPASANVDAAPGTTVSPANTPGSAAATGIPPVNPVVRIPAAPTPGDPTTPAASRPQGMSPALSTGGGVPIPTRPGGAGGVGSGNQPGFGGTGNR